MRGGSSLKPRIYNRDMELVGVLQNATSIGYTRAHNDLFTASFELPLDDPKTSLCDTHSIIDIFDGESSKGKYRILDEQEADVTSSGQFVKYSCEHVIAFLLNDVIDGYLEIGGTGVTTRTVIENILARQTVKRWQLGTCDFNYQFRYSWENTNLLDALFSIPTCFVDGYHWTYDTNSYPWTINLVQQNTDRSCEIRRKRNMQQIKREKDSSALCTRLYCKGSGEGVNQVGIAEVNGGKPYIDADTIPLYGVLASHYIDLQVTDAETLLAKGRAVLEEVKHPRYTYKAKAVDLAKITGLDWHAFDEGKYVHLIDEEKGIDLDAMIIEVGKSDVDGDPLDIDVTISNKSSDVSSAIEDLSRRTAITAQYSQGATNLYAQQYADNADASHPATMRVYVPHGCVKINQMLLSWRIDSFRAYETGAAAGGATVTTTESGGGSSETTSAGGGSETTSSAGGNTQVTVEQRVSSTNLAVGMPLRSDTGAEMYYVDDNGAQTTGSAGGHLHNVLSHNHSFSDSYSLSWGHTHSVSQTGLDGGTTGGVNNYSIKNISISGMTGSATTTTSSAAGHSHTVSAHNHYFRHFHTGAVTITIPGQTVDIPSHRHNITIPSHSHGITIPSHSHSLTLGDHTHRIEYGIYEGGIANAIALNVDGNLVPSSEVENNEMDIVAYLDKDSNGKITRGTWHEIQLVPNSLCRIEANLFVQTFITSYSGGNY